LTFLLVVLNTQDIQLLNYPLPASNSPHPAKISSQIWLLAPRGGALATYPYKLRPKIFSSPWGASAPTGYAYGHCF